MRYNDSSTFTRVNIINFKDKKEINQISSPIASSNTAVSVSVANTQLKIATFNLFNYLEPPYAYYDFDRIYSAEQWQKKQRWLTDYLREYQPDIIGFQEVFSSESLKELVASQGYGYFEVVDQPEVIDDFIYKRPVVAIASRYPIVDIKTVEPSIDLAQTLGLTDDFSFSRKVLRATVDAPHMGNCDCYVVHFKSKRPMIEVDEQDNSRSAEQTIIETLKADVAGGWGSTIRRGSEATLLMIAMIDRREATGYPMVLMGDFNNTLADGVLSHLLTNSLRFASSDDCDAYLAKYCLNDSWDLFQHVLSNDVNDIYETSVINVPNEIDETAIEINRKENLERSPTHYYGGSGSVLDYILLSCEFDASYQDSLFQVSTYNTYNRHLINPIFDRDGESTDHGVVLVTLTLRS